MSQRNEEFIHFDLCLERLAGAWRTLTAIKQDANHPLVGPAFRFALVEYAAPYTRSDGVHKSRYCLDKQYVPVEFLELHHRIVESRHQVHAHTDLRPLNSKLSFVDLPNQRLVSTSRNGIHGLEDLGNIDAIIVLVEKTISNMCADRDRRKLQLET